jgi:two-component system aerobic respiration control sensor histidine kinase ArcB
MEETMLKIESKEESEIVQSLRNKIDELENVLALMPGHVYWMSKEEYYLGSNTQVAKFLNLQSREQMIGKHLTDVVPHNDAQAIRKVNHLVMEEGKTYLGEEICEIPGHEGIYLTQKVPLKNKEMKIIGLLGISLNITDQKKIEKELQEAKEIAEIANQTKTEFIRNMEHDIRTPLCGIMGVVAYLNSIEQDSTKKEFLNEVERSTNELLNYLDNIVEFSQMNTGTVPMILKEFNLKQMLNGILNLESAAAKHKTLDLILIYPESIPRLVVGDRFRLHRILLNLVNNAIKFTEQGYVKIHVNVLEFSSPEEVRIEIAIEDTGIGIEKKYHQPIYDKFMRCDPSNKGVYKGTGLGLWIVRQFINDLKGTISLESQRGKGSVFTCTFPFQLAKSKYL